MKSVYIHIPFCTNICSYCDFSKIFYNNKIVNEYLKVLEKEIDNNYKNELINTIYIGGGTPSSLNYEELETLFKIIKKFKLSDNYEFTIECNPENTDENKVKLFSKYGVNRVSIGVQSFNDKYLKILERKHTKKDVYNLVKCLKNNDIYNINIDLIFGINDQDIKDIKEDLDNFIMLDIPHISYYSLILEPNTKLYIDEYEEINDDKCADMYEYICNYLKDKNYIHYEISNFSKKGYESKHNLTYWNNEEYYGFGLGAHGFINNVRYENTRSFTKYLKGNYRLNEFNMTESSNIENEVILGFRKLKGINKAEFEKKYNFNIYDKFNFKNLIKNDLIRDDGKNLYINSKYIFISNEILVKVLESSSEYVI